jgi:hypothetical protein
MSGCYNTPAAYQRDDHLPRDEDPATAPLPGSSQRAQSRRPIKALQRPGLGQKYEDVPFREDPAFDQLRKHGVLAPGVDESIWDELSSWWAPPEYVIVDVKRTIREGRIVTATQSESL